MKQLVLALAMVLVSSISQARPPLPSGLKAIDKEGAAYLRRDGQNAALIITDEAAVELLQWLSTGLNDQARLHCASESCVIGQISRDGQFGALTGRFANQDYFKRFMQLRKNPESFFDASYYEDFAGKAYANPSQCQDEKRRPVPIEELTLKGIVAEQLYNFLQVEETNGERAFGNAKANRDQSIFCEKLPQYAEQDYSATGQPLPGVPPSYTEYQCFLRFDRAGIPQKRGECSIYGGTISAGGGSQ